jgi:hypothetical protein
MQINFLVAEFKILAACIIEGMASLQNMMHHTIYLKREHFSAKYEGKYRKDNFITRSRNKEYISIPTTETSSSNS